MPTKSDAGREVQLGIGQGLAIVAQTQVQSEMRTYFPIILDESSQKPLAQVVAADAEIDRLLVVLDVGQRQLTQRRRSRVLESKRAQHRRSRFAPESTRAMTNDAAAEAQIMLAGRPRERIGKLKLMTPQVREA